MTEFSYFCELSMYVFYILCGMVDRVMLHFSDLRENRGLTPVNVKSQLTGI